MNKIAQLMKNIAGLQRIQIRLINLEKLHWKTPEVRAAAVLVRNTFNTFEQKWRDGMGENKFFVFCIPSYPVYDGPPEFLHNPLDTDEKNQDNFVDGCRNLKSGIAIRIKKMQDDRARLLSLHNQGALIQVFADFDALNEELAKIAEQEKSTVLDFNKAVQSWDHQLIASLKQNDLQTRFNAIFADSSEPLIDRIRKREESVEAMADSLASNPSEHLRKEQVAMTQNYNFGDNTTVGGINNGSNNQMNVNMNIVQRDHKELKDALQQLLEQINSEIIEKETKENAVNAVITVSTELEKEEKDQEGWKVVESLEKLGKIADASVKLQPLVSKIVELIGQQVSNFPPINLG